MNSKKLSPEEIQALRVNAEKERATHASVMTNLSHVILSPTLQMTTLMSSYERHRIDEIMVLLDTYAIGGKKQYEMATEVMQFIYDHGDELPEVKTYMLQNNHLVYEIEKRIFDDKLAPFFKDENGIITYPKFSPNAEVYMVTETLKACQKANRLTNELNFLNFYISKHELSSLAEVALTEFLFASHGRDSVLDSLQTFILGYLDHYGNVCRAAQLRIIQSGNHDVILYYIRHAQPLINAQEVIDALMERADEEEVVAYYNRWAKED